MSNFHSDGKFIYVDDDYMEIYIPTEYFDPRKRFATDYSSYIETMGLVHCGLFSKGNLLEIKLMKHPYRITLYVYDSDIGSIEIPHIGQTTCHVLKYTRGSKLMDAVIVQDAQSSLQYLDMCMDGKIPKSVPYDKARESLQKNKRMNNVSFGVRNEVEELVLGISYRDPNNMNTKFAELFGSDMNVSPYGYVTANTRQVCQYSSTFAALTFEDIDTMITTSVNRTREKKSEDYTPVESIIKM